MRIVTFGASGGTGRQFLEQALAAGHDVVAVARDPASVATRHPRLRVEAADVFDAAALAPLLAGADAVVSALGSRSPAKPTTVCSRAIAAILDAMQRAGVRRLVVVSASGMVVDDGDGWLERHVLKPILGRILRHPFTDLREMERRIFASDRDWTIVRPPRLTNGPRTGRYRSARGRNVRGGTISRADVADCALRLLDDASAHRTTVGIAS